ncbi:hypothetical protein F444_01782 [Phytophthora nicotianae P1976]|uniref:AWS domain-containing protein n=2 Tax=Phytophthora nicotianae TaxID=4792 RepID=A0A081AZL0_PHYNI|nr:hypothetical protein F444_01782 [Phytophthora nicotianae P1976]
MDRFLARSEPPPNTSTSDGVLDLTKRVLNKDEIPECKCNRGEDWTEVCGIGCENRSMQVECVRGKCVTEGPCSNQQMQNGSIALLSIKKLHDKGISLFASQPILPGAFVCQYTGEIIESSTYSRRDKEFKGSTNYYGMSLTKGEVIDARACGGIARLANHS